MYFIVSHFYHEPPAREIGQLLPVYLTVNKSIYLSIYIALFLEYTVYVPHVARFIKHLLLF